MLPRYSKKEITKAERVIYSFIKKDYNIHGTLGSANGVVMPTDLREAVLYESSYTDCTWGESDWSGLSGNGCRFTKCDFFTNVIYNSALQHALFDKAIFYNCNFKGSNFAYSIFTWSQLKKCPIEGCAFTGAIFNHVTLKDSKITQSNFELCKFQNTRFINMDLSNLTLKYTFFYNVSMDNVILSFMQLPYSFGGMTYIFNTKDDVKISTTNPKYPLITINKYKDMVSELITFFGGHNEYFPLANCYLANKQIDLAEQANEAGIVSSATLHDFRKLYFFCIQATQELKISKIKRYKLYNRINQLLSLSELNRAEYQEFRHYFPMIKQLMFDNPHNNPTLLLSFHTNIDSEDFDNLGILMRILDELAEECGVNLDSKHIEIRHDSPNIVDWLPIGNIEQLINLLQSTWNTISPILSSTLQGAANVTTVITGLYGFHKLIQARKNDRENKDAKGIDRKKKKDSMPAIDTRNIPPDHAETLRLRIELYRQEEEWKEKNITVSQTTTLKPILVSKKLKEKIEVLKRSGITIDELEVQILDEKCDALDHLYNSDNDPI